jgi:hypothetical protein
MPSKPNHIRVRRDCTGGNCVFTEEGTIGKAATKLYWVRKLDTDPNADPGLDFEFDPVRPLVFPANSPFNITRISPKKITVSYKGESQDKEWVYSINVNDLNAKGVDQHILSDGTPIIRNH